MSLAPRRLEELGLNSSAPPAQLLYDGWLLRLSPGKAKRARSVNAVYPSTLPLAEKIAYCERLYAVAGLPAIFRITPFSQPPELEALLARRGYGRFEPTAVEWAALDDAPAVPAGVEELAIGPWVEAVARLRGSPAGHLAPHRARLEALPLAKRAVAVEEGGAVVATGLTVVEDGVAGLFDIVTHPQWRRRGLARRIVTALLAHAGAFGARQAYLQVDAANDPARRLYAGFGFAEAYRYWYLGRPGEQG